jgi:hypothetical protein
VEYLLELSEGVTGRIIGVLRRAALQGIADKTQKAGCHLRLTAASRDQTHRAGSQGHGLIGRAEPMDRAPVLRTFEVRAG